MPDISIILNVHNEWKYLQRTILSLRDAVQFSALNGRTFELIVVLDSADDQTRNLCYKDKLLSFCPTQIIEVSFRSLSKSRQAGLEASSGRYIATADADDLISFNFFESCYLVCAGQENPVIAVQEYIFGFGSNYHIWKYFDSEIINPLKFFPENPFTSRLLAPRDLMVEAGYREPQTSHGEAFEDWDINNRLIERGAKFKVAPDTVLFYRQRRDGIMGGLQGTRRVVAFSNLHMPERFIDLCAEGYKHIDQYPLPPRAEAMREEFYSRETLVDVIQAANAIDPSIRYDDLRSVPMGTNNHPSDRWGAAYYEVCEKIKGRKFTDVVLMPYFSLGGGEKYILQIISSIKSQWPDRKFLVITGEQHSKHEFVTPLPEDTVLLDLYEICHRRDAISAINIIVLRTLQATASAANLLIKASPFAENFVRQYGRMLRDQRVVFFYFSDGEVRSRGTIRIDGYSFEFISDCLDQFSLVVSDHKRILDLLELRLGEVNVPRVVIPNKCEVLEPARQSSSQNGTLRLLWASRIAREKRPELVLAIADRIEEVGLDCTIDVYGSPTDGGPKVSMFENRKALRYRGAYSGFASINPQSYDAFLYTTMFDGLPNVVLEALGAGLPVIAPRVGGIPEVVCSENGILVPNIGDDKKLVSLYIDAVQKVIQSDRRKLSASARAVIATGYSTSAFDSAVSTVFGPRGDWGA